VADFFLKKNPTLAQSPFLGLLEITLSKIVQSEQQGQTI
jgi:hypothetical protein